MFEQQMNLSCNALDGAFVVPPQWQIGLFPTKPLKLQTLTDFGTFFGPFQRRDLCKNPGDSHIQIGAVKQSILK